MSNTLLLNRQPTLGSVKQNLDRRPNMTSVQLNAVKTWFDAKVKIVPTGQGERVVDLYSNFVVFLKDQQIPTELSKRLFVKAVLFILQELKNHPDAVITKAKARVISHIELNHPFNQ